VSSTLLSQNLAMSLAPLSQNSAVSLGPLSQNSWASLILLSQNTAVSLTPLSQFIILQSPHLFKETFKQIQAIMILTIQHLWGKSVKKGIALGNFFDSVVLLTLLSQLQV
jgi:hypothetical protein